MRSVWFYKMDFCNFTKESDLKEKNPTLGGPKLLLEMYCLAKLATTISLMFCWEPFDKVPHV